MFDLSGLTSREFEILAANYAAYIAPDCQWVMTKQVADFNRDFEALFANTKRWSWGEAKHTQKPDTSVQKSRWDPTLLSTFLKNDVDELFLITYGKIPLEYIERAEHFKIKNINKIIYINGFLLNEWLKKLYSFSSFNCFGEQGFDQFTFQKKIKNKTTYKYTDTCHISMFHRTDNLLEPINAKKTPIQNLSPYELNITVFMVQNTDLNISITPNFKIHKVLLKHLSQYENQQQVIYSNCAEKFCLNSINIPVTLGYSQIVVFGVVQDHTLEKLTVRLNSNKKKVSCKHFRIIAEKSIGEQQLSDLALVENAIDKNKLNKNNIILYTKSLSITSLDRFGDEMSYYSFEFNNSLCDNAVFLCRIITLLIFGMYYVVDDENTLKKVMKDYLQFCPFWLNDVFIGTLSPIFALSVLRYIKNQKNNINLNEIELKLNEKSVIIIKGRHLLPLFLNNVLLFFLNFFTTKNTESIIICDESVDVTNKKHHKLDKITKTSEENKIIESAITEEKFIDSHIDYLIPYLDKYYDKSDFYKALFFFHILKDKNCLEKLDLKYRFRYGECLNHFDIMEEAQIQFNKVISDGDFNNESMSKIILEAQTEVFNLRFWRLDVTDLINDIDIILKDHILNLRSETGNARDKYAFLNCLNRKMVTQYLLGDYEQAEFTYQECISYCDEQYENYLAFAHMDSARGLYAKNLPEAKRRMKKAHIILKKFNDADKEQRRYADCEVEMAYIQFICEYKKKKKNISIDSLENAVAYVKYKGYRGILINSYLKLATCYLINGDTDMAKRFLTFVQSNCDMNDNIRVRMLYHNILSNVFAVECAKDLIRHDHSIKNSKLSSSTIYPNIAKEIELELRIW